MKLTFKLLFVVLILAAPKHAQPAEDTFASLTEQVEAAKSFEAVEAAEKSAKSLFSGKKKTLGQNKELLAREMLEFALFRKAVLLRLNPRGENRVYPKGGGREFLKFYRKNFDQLESLFESSIDIYEKDLKVENEYLATAKFELARTREDNFLTQNASIPWNRHLENSEKNQDLYLDAFLIREKVLGNQDDSYLISAFYLANAYAGSADFEKALPYYEKYIIGYREKYKRSSNAVLPALIMTGSIWKLVGNSANVQKIASEIASITGKEVSFGEAPLMISPRATSFKHKGINPIYGGFFVDQQTGIMADGREVYLGSMNDIRRRQVDNPQNPIILGSGRSSVKRSEVYKVLVKVDTKGKVTWLKAEIKDSENRQKVESRVRKWKFRPFVIDGKPMQMFGYVSYYDLKEASVQ